MHALTTTVARVLYGLPFGIFGLFHLTQAPQMAGIVPGWMPGAVFWVYFTGVCLVAASVAILSKRYARLACLLLAALLWVFILTVHLPGVADPETMQESLISLLKDMALSGGALAYAGHFGASS